jgi:hypothetical protein
VQNLHYKTYFFEDLDTARRIVLKWLLKKLGGMMWTGFIGLRI